MKYCIYCGSEIVADGKFCGQCGKAIFEFNSNTKLELENDKQSDSQQESITVDIEQPVREPQSKSNAISDSALNNNNEVLKKGGINMLAVVLCSIAAILVIAFVILMVIKKSKTKYRIVYPKQTSQTIIPSNSITISPNDFIINLA